jgi:hypothetical protein
LAAYVGACKHPRGARAVFDDATGHFRLPQPAETEKVYSFNGLGFRGEDYNPDADLQIYTCGCSYTFGKGIELEQAWPALVATATAKALGIAAERAAVQNFSQIGASNNYIIRTLIEQCDRAPPGLAIAAFTHANRTEYLDGPKFSNLGHWDIAQERKNIYGARFFRHYVDALGLENLLVAMLLFQSAMQKRGIPYLILWIDCARFEDFESEVPPALAALYAQLDRSRVSKLSLIGEDIFRDEVEYHPGPQSHARFAELLALEFRGRLLIPSRPARASPDGGLLEIGTVSATPALRLLLERASEAGSANVKIRIAHELTSDHFIAGAPVSLDLEGSVWHPSKAALRRAIADYVSADTLWFDTWLKLLAAQEFIEARGGRLRVELPAMWMPDPNTTNPAVAALLGLRTSGIFVPAAGNGESDLPSRLAKVKRKLSRSLIARLSRRFGTIKPKARNDDPNLYPLW